MNNYDGYEKMVLDKSYYITEHNRQTAKDIFLDNEYFLYNAYAENTIEE